jgi:DNA-binding response OmpR family regulator
MTLPAQQIPQPAQRFRVLIVEDDQSLLTALRYSLSREGYAVTTATDGGEALNRARDDTPDMIILDLMLPTMNGLEVCRTLRKEGDIVPILILTAKDSEVDRVVGIEVGADDYVAKPFSMRELLARVAALLRRAAIYRESSSGASRANRIVFGDWTLDTAARSLANGDRSVGLRPKEFDLLTFFARNRGRAFSRDQLLKAVWGFDYPGESRTVDVHVRWLREKIEPSPGEPRFIFTVRGLGYRFAD